MLETDTLLQNRYRVVRHIGQGGMGSVYEAVDLRLGNSVALKQMTLAGEQISRAFEREARLLAGLRHPALPRVIDHFADSAGQFLVMEFIPGPDLASMLAQRGSRFPLDDVLRWGDQLLDALEYLHTQQPPVIHRDIKPQNLKLTPRGEIILLDFGLAKGMASAQTQSTSGMSLFGYTPQYAPIEQIQGTGTDARSDLYSLSATLYRLVTGVPPAGALDRATAVVDRQADPLRPAHEVAPDVPPAVSAALMHGLALSRAERPASAAELRAALAGARRAGADSVPTAVSRYPDSTIADAPTQVNPRVKPIALARPQPQVPRSGRSAWLGPAIGGVVALIAIVSALALLRGQAQQQNRSGVTPAATAVIAIQPTAAPLPTFAPLTSAIAALPTAPPSAPTALVPQLTPGGQALTKKGTARDLFTQPEGGDKVVERPKLFGGAQVTLLVVQPGAVQVRTPEGVEGWLHEPAEAALTDDLSAIGEQAPFVAGARVQIVRATGIPLRQDPNSSAPKLREQLAAGQQATIQEVRGDWLLVRLDDGTIGWARWYYDGQHYADVVAPPAFARTLSVQSPRLSGDDVRTVQQRLRDLGYREVGDIDGLYGPNTEAAVRRFQAANGLDVDGLVGPQTWNKLFGEGAVFADER